MQIESTNPFYCVLYIYHLIHFEAILFLYSFQNIPCLICGDFNLPGICWSSLTGSTRLSTIFCDFIFNWNLTQHVTSSTHIKGNILDLVLTTQSILISGITTMCHNTLIHTDHSIISFNLQFETLLPNLTNACCVLDYSDADWDGLSSYLLDTDFSDCFQSSDIQFVWNTIKKNIYDAIDLFIPKLNRRARQFPKWFTAKLRHRLNCVRTLRRKVKLHPSEKLKIKIKSKDFMT